jgi:hypothetical protein
MNKNAVSTLLSVGIFVVVLYMFKDQLKAVFSGNTVGNSTRGLAALGARTALAAAPDLVRTPAGDTFQRIASGVDNTGAGNTGGLGITGSD